RLGRLRLHIPAERYGDVGRKGHIEIAGGESKNARRAVLDDLELDAIEVGLALLPVVRVLHELDRFAAPVFDELEGTCADRLRAHVALGDVAWIDRRITRREQQRER